MGLAHLYASWDILLYFAILKGFKRVEVLQNPQSM